MKKILLILSSVFCLLSSVFFLVGCASTDSELIIPDIVTAYNPDSFLQSYDGLNNITYTTHDDMVLESRYNLSNNLRSHAINIRMYISDSELLCVVDTKGYDWTSFTSAVLWSGKARQELLFSGYDCSIVNLNIYKEQNTIKVKGETVDKLIAILSAESPMIGFHKEKNIAPIAIPRKVQNAMLETLYLYQELTKPEVLPEPETLPEPEPEPKKNTYQVTENPALRVDYNPVRNSYDYWIEEEYPNIAQTDDYSLSIAMSAWKHASDGVKLEYAYSSPVLHNFNRFVFVGDNPQKDRFESFPFESYNFAAESGFGEWAEYQLSYQAEIFPLLKFLVKNENISVALLGDIDTELIPIPEETRINYISVLAKYLDITEVSY